MKKLTTKEQINIIHEKAKFIYENVPDHILRQIADRQININGNIFVFRSRTHWNSSKAITVADASGYTELWNEDWSVYGVPQLKWKKLKAHIKRIGLPKIVEHFVSLAKHVVEQTEAYIAYQYTVIETLKKDKEKLSEKLSSIGTIGDQLVNKVNEQNS